MLRTPDQGEVDGGCGWPLSRGGAGGAFHEPKASNHTDTCIHFLFVLDMESILHTFVSHGHDIDALSWLPEAYDAQQTHSDAPRAIAGETMVRP